MSNTPISVDLPHRLGAEEAKRRIARQYRQASAGHLPAGAQVRSAWDGDRLTLGIAADRARSWTPAIDVQESLVRVSVLLPPALAFFGKAIEAGLRRSAPQLLEDREATGARMPPRGAALNRGRRTAEAGCGMLR